MGTAKAQQNIIRPQKLTKDVSISEVGKKDVKSSASAKKPVQGKPSKDSRKQSARGKTKVENPKEDSEPESSKEETGNESQEDEPATTYECGVKDCQEAFTVFSDWETHVQVVHKRKLPYNTDTPVNFQDETSGATNEDISGDEERSGASSPMMQKGRSIGYQCKQCPSKYLLQVELARHIQSNHKNDKSDSKNEISKSGKKTKGSKKETKSEDKEDGDYEEYKPGKTKSGKTKTSTIIDDSNSSKRPVRSTRSSAKA